MWHEHCSVSLPTPPLQLSPSTTLGCTPVSSGHLPRVSRGPQALGVGPWDPARPRCSSPTPTSPRNWVGEIKAALASQGHKNGVGGAGEPRP